MRYLKASREELQAPKGKFRVIGVDVNEGATGIYQLGDFETLELSEKLAKEKATIGVAGLGFPYARDQNYRFLLCTSNDA